MQVSNEALRAASIALAIVAWVARIASIAMCAITVILCFSGLTAQLNMVGFIVDLSRALPGAIAGYGVMTTPFGGVFRLDFAVIAVLLMALDYACLHASVRLRTR